MKKFLGKIGFVAFLSFALVSVVACSIFHKNETSITINFGSNSRAARADLAFDVYFNNNLVGEKVQGSFSASAIVGTKVTVRVDAFWAGERLATGETTITVTAGENTANVKLKSIDEQGQKEMYTVIYDTAEGSWQEEGDGFVSGERTESHKAGETVTIISAEPVHPDNKKFLGWQDMTEEVVPSSGSRFSGGDKFTMPSHYVTLTAVWSASN